MEEKENVIPAEEQVETEVQEEVPATNGKEEEPVRGRKAMRARYSAKYPEKNWDEEDDDALADQAMSDYDSLEGQMKERDDADKKLSDLFEKNPQSASFLMGMAQGEDFLVNLQKNFGADIVDAMQNPDKLEELSKANKEYQDKVSKNKELQKAWEDNMAASLDNIAQCQEEMGISDEDVQEGMDELARIVNEFNNGNLSMDTIQMFLKAKNHDMDVEAAKKKGEVAGRNANIEEKLRKSRQQTDGAPSLGGQSNKNAAGRAFRQGGGMGQGASIWDKGNFKRNNY